MIWTGRSEKTLVSMDKAVTIRLTSPPHHLLDTFRNSGCHVSPNYTKHQNARTSTSRLAKAAGVADVTKRHKTQRLEDWSPILPC
ncbi:hypothetical protein RRG08_059931 [Elysia crispata]|uniref:Uncharacterized protein n=1 Tax=Elysia crispata TaxID=231223 RepID=A0AAE1CU28_9GAST|nr:hypothetical protein RRG08_059931 [Elysia crispata]